MDDGAFKKLGLDQGVSMIRIFADFNARTSRAPTGGSVPLFSDGGLADIRHQNVELYEGLHIIVYDGECQAEAVVEKAEGDWWGRIVGVISCIPENERRLPDLGDMRFCISGKFYGWSELKWQDEDMKR